MKARITQLNFRKDQTFDPFGLMSDEFAMPYILELKKHWWSRWKYVMDDETRMPRLFFGKTSLATCIYKNDVTRIEWNQ